MLETLPRAGMRQRQGPLLGATAEVSLYLQQSSSITRLREYYSEYGTSQPARRPAPHVAGRSPSTAGSPLGYIVLQSCTQHLDTCPSRAPEGDDWRGSGQMAIDTGNKEVPG